MSLKVREQFSGVNILIVPVTFREHVEFLSFAASNFTTFIFIVPHFKLQNKNI